MSIKEKGISISLGLIFSIIAGVGSYYTGKANAQTERALLKNEVKHLKERVVVLEATKPEIVAYRVTELTKKVDQIQSGQTIINLSQAFEGKLPFISNLKTVLDIFLSQKIPLEIFIKTGASSINVDLSSLRIEYLEINSGASNIGIKLTEDFGQKIFIKTGASTISIEIPENLAAKIIVDSQVKSVNAADRFKKVGNSYQTENYDKSVNKADIEIKAVAGSVEIK